MEKSIITVVGKDKVGIIADICMLLKQGNANILDISQTIVDGFFNMMMIVDTSSCADFFLLSEKLEEKGKELNVEVKLQKEEIFSYMQRL